MRPGDIIIEKSGGSDKRPVGRVVYYDGAPDIYLFNNFTGVLQIINPVQWNSKYLFYALYANYLRGGTRKYQNKTTGLHNLKTDQYVEEFKVDEIPLSDQYHVADILDKLLELISLRKQQLAKLDELVKARFVEMFGDPVQKSNRSPHVPMTELCEIIDGDRGTNYPKQEEFSKKGYCLFLNTKNVTAQGFSFDSCQYITAGKDALLRKGRLCRGDIVLTTRGTIGNLAFYDDSVPFENIRINSGMVILRIDREVLKEIFFIEQFKMLLPSIKEQIASGSAQPQLPIFTIYKVLILLPDIDEQNNFSDFVEEINRQSLTIQQSLDKLEVLKKALMQEYFN